VVDWKLVLASLELLNDTTDGHRVNIEHAHRLCTAASRLPEGVDAVKVLEEYGKPARIQYGSFLRCRGYADCSEHQQLAGCAECERVK
jgi:hypothetical protein